MTDKFVSSSPPPTAHQREIAEVLIEECVEVTQECAKITQHCTQDMQRATKLLRFGVEEVQPGQAMTNKQRLSLEIGDLLVVIEVAVEAGIVDPVGVELGKVAKRQQLDRFLQTQPD